MRPSVQVTPNVTPMVDVMLVLLIIFMVITPALLDGFVVQPPTAANVRDHPHDSADVTLGIDGVGRYFLNKRLIAAAALGPELESIYGAGRADRVMYLKADRDLDYAKVLAAVDIARNSGVVMIGMITHQPGRMRP